MWRRDGVLERLFWPAIVSVSALEFIASVEHKQVDVAPALVCALDVAVLFAWKVRGCPELRWFAWHSAHVALSSKFMIEATVMTFNNNCKQHSLTAGLCSNIWSSIRHPGRPACTPHYRYLWAWNKVQDCLQPGAGCVSHLRTCAGWYSCRCWAVCVPKVAQPQGCCVNLHTAFKRSSSTRLCQLLRAMVLPVTAFGAMKPSRFEGSQSRLSLLCTRIY